MKTVNPVAFSVLGRPIYWYGILIAVAVLLGIYLAYRESRRKGWDADALMDFAILAVPLAIVCARLYYVVFEWPRYASNPITALYIWQGGIAIYGAVIGGVLAAVIFCRRKKKKLWQLLDICAPSLVLGQCIGRWGNFFNQEAFGYEVASASQQWFPFAVYIENSGTWHYATFFYESLSCAIIFLVLLFFRRRTKEDGNVFLLYLLLYGIERAFVEGLRTDSLYIGSLRVSQMLSVVLALASAVALLIRWRRSVVDSGEVDPRLAMLRHDRGDGEDLSESEPQPEESAAVADAKTQTAVSADPEGTQATASDSCTLPAQQESEPSPDPKDGQSEPNADSVRDTDKKGEI